MAEVRASGYARQGGPTSKTTDVSWKTGNLTITFLAQPARGYLRWPHRREYLPTPPITRLSHELMMCGVLWEKVPSPIRTFVAAIGMGLLLIAWALAVFVFMSAIEPVR